MPVMGAMQIPSTDLAPVREVSSAMVKASDMVLNEAPLTSRGAAESYLAAGLSPAAGAGVAGADGAAVMVGTATGAEAL